MDLRGSLPNTDTYKREIEIELERQKIVEKYTIFLFIMFYIRKMIRPKSSSIKYSKPQGKWTTELTLTCKNNNINNFNNVLKWELKYSFENIFKREYKYFEFIQIQAFRTI